MSNPTTFTLPEKPSDLIRRALADLERVEQDPRYRVDMGAWHDPTADCCLVCFAGAVIAAHINDPDRCILPHQFGSNIAAKLVALDSFRVGKARRALVEFGVGSDKAGQFPADYDVPNYSDNPSGFKVAMRVIAAHLAMVGL
jgi:hypothetical protein